MLKINKYTYPDLVRDEIIILYKLSICDTKRSYTHHQADIKEIQQAVERMRKKKVLFERYFDFYIKEGEEKSGKILRRNSQ